MDPVSTVIIVYLFIMLFISIFGNSSTILIISLNREMKTTNNLFILNLAVSDLFFSLVATPLRFVHMFGGVVTLEFCKAALFLGMFFFHASVAGLLILSIDRYICITRPLHYQSSLIKRRAKVVLVIGWLLALLISLLPLTNIDIFNPEKEYNNTCRYGTIMSKNYLIFLIVLTEFVSTFIIIILYGHIFLVANRQAKKILEERRIHTTVMETDQEINGISVEPSSCGWEHEYDSDGATTTHSSGKLKHMSPKKAKFNFLTSCLNWRSKGAIHPATPQGNGISNSGFLKCEDDDLKSLPVAIIHSGHLSYCHVTNKFETHSAVLNTAIAPMVQTFHEKITGEIYHTNPNGEVPSMKENSFLTIPESSFKEHKNAVSKSSSLRSTNNSSARKKVKRKRLVAFKREYKAAKLIGAVVGLFMICVLPIAFIDILELTNVTNQVPLWLVNVAICLVSTNPAVNSILYAIGKNDFRMSYYKLWTCGRYVKGH